MNHRRLDRSSVLLLLLAFSLTIQAPIQAATLKGQITIDGKAPKDKAIDMSGDPNCMKLQPGKVFDNFFVVSKNGSIPNVFVYLDGSALHGKAYEAPAKKIFLNQRNCRFEPKVVGVLAGQKIFIHNDDPTLHNVHAMPKAEGNREFNLGMPFQGMTVKKLFKAPEMMMRVKCDVHPWMTAYIAVMDHPFFMTTGSDGAFDLEGVPAGKYQLRVWHPRYANPAKSFSVELVEGTSKTFDVTLEPPKVQ